MRVVPTFMRSAFRPRGAGLRIGTVFVLALAPAASIGAQDAHTSEANVGGVTIRGTERSSGGRVPHNPEFEVHNGSARPRHIRIVALESLAEGGEHRVLAARGTAAWTIAAGAHATLSIDYAGDALQAGRGLPWHRFRATFDVDGTRVNALATTAYLERIPLRRGAIFVPPEGLATLRGKALGSR